MNNESKRPKGNYFSYTQNNVFLSVDLVVS
jgi:hypothetical protein